MNKKAVYIGRFNPFHNGHSAVIREMLTKYAAEDCLLIIGSSNAAFSLRHFFSYHERKQFIQKVFPAINMVGLPDYHNDAEWLAALDDILSVAGIEREQVTFFGGCHEDIRFFLDDGRNCHIRNRFEGANAQISATEVRDALIAGRPLDHLVDPLILTDLQDAFKVKWEKFKKI